MSEFLHLVMLLRCVRWIIFVDCVGDQHRKQLEVGSPSTYKEGLTGRALEPKPAMLLSMVTNVVLKKAHL